MPTDTPVITTVIPTYRRPHLLRRAIRSVLAQTYPHLRVCVYDNASGDETAAVVDELARHDPRIEYHCHAENIGANANFAYGMERIATPFFSILSDDDYYLPTFFETAMTGFDTHPDAISSGGATVVITERGTVTYSSSSEGYFAPPSGVAEFIVGKYPLIIGHLFRREVLEQAGFVDPSIFYWDIDYMCNVTARYPSVVSKKPSVIVTLHEQQSTKGVEVQRAIQGYHAIRERIRDNPLLSSDIRLQSEDALARLFGGIMLLSIGEPALLRGDFARARESATALRSEFHMHVRAFMLDLLAALCRRSRLLHRFVRALLLALYELFLRYRSWRYRTIHAEIREYLPTSISR